MPLQGHWARQNAPFVPSSRRELRLVVSAAIVAALATIVICVAVIASRGPSAHTGCRLQVVAMTTGGATIEHCPAAKTPQSTDR